MSDTTHIKIAFVPAIENEIDQFLASVGFGFNPSHMRKFARRDALRLSAKTDAELAQLGITRADIPAFVLRHKLPGYAPILRRRALVGD
ncbi:hypothetical protein G5B39_10790 [Rhodobacteraceae bacterium SC52]|nr:hypothetical protein G5B39_10790 [Rhodobacteraceae bacterium SC52]